MICSSTVGGWEQVPSSSVAMMARATFKLCATRGTAPDSPRMDDQDRQSTSPLPEPTEPVPAVTRVEHFF